MSEEIEKLISEVGLEQAGRRLDQVVAEQFAQFSRSRLQRWIKDGRLLLDGRPGKPKQKVRGGERLELVPQLEQEVTSRPQLIPLDILFEDESLLVVNKPAGLVVHPAVGNPDGTLLNALLHHFPAISQVPRGGIVHRLDKETSGLLVVAKTLQAQTALVAQLQARSMKREYRAFAQGVMTAGGKVDAPIGRHPVHRTRMAVVANGKPAVTHYRVIERYRFHTDLRIQLETGRTHQIRVHMAQIRFPLVGDPVYGGRLRLPTGISDALAEGLRAFKRQALHARRLELVHPESGEQMSWEAPLPEDMEQLLGLLRADAAG
ncbi:23S rRNA pseudouridine(1911/1915/1917) synthase RluD [endosymbiont of Ridgeia piscesae]|nr:23S rRNA pseudouridine(1911/1915/1917) synthase RluD [endosymbiont of Ridgeia piscesae]